MHDQMLRRMNEAKRKKEKAEEAVKKEAENPRRVGAKEARRNAARLKNGSTNA